MELLLSLSFQYSNFSSIFHLSLVQQQSTLMFASILNSFNCPFNVEHKTCLRIQMALVLIEMFSFTNVTRVLTSRDVSVSASFDLGFTAVNDFEFDLYFYPTSNSKHVTFQYHGQSASLSLPLINCSSPFVFYSDQCFCPSGFYFTFGDCLPCPIGTFKSMTHASCLPCPYQRITRSNSSSSVNDCVCDRNLYLINNTCGKCPKNTDSHYGSIIKVRDGLYFDDFNHVTVKCALPYLCRNGACTSTCFN
ncbi:hypothetical protein GEMRC1_007748 [Eukaryota sp. GEM-RC1]